MKSEVGGEWKASQKRGKESETETEKKQQIKGEKSFCTQKKN